MDVNNLIPSSQKTYHHYNVFRQICAFGNEMYSNQEDVPIHQVIEIFISVEEKKHYPIYEQNIDLLKEDEQHFREYNNILELFHVAKIKEDNPELKYLK